MGIGAGGKFAAAMYVGNVEVSSLLLGLSGRHADRFHSASWTMHALRSTVLYIGHRGEFRAARKVRRMHRRAISPRLAISSLPMAFRGESFAACGLYQLKTQLETLPGGGAADRYN